MKANAGWLDKNLLFVLLNEMFQATSSCDGSVKIFNIDKQTLIKQLNILTKSNDIESV